MNTKVSTCGLDNNKRTRSSRFVILKKAGDSRYEQEHDHLTVFIFIQECNTHHAVTMCYATKRKLTHGLGLAHYLLFNSIDLVSL